MEGHFTSLKFMALVDLDISDMSSQVLAKLSSVVTGRINVIRVTGDIYPILANLECKLLELRGMTITESSLPAEIKVNRVALYDLKGDTTSLIKLLHCKEHLFIYKMTLTFILSVQRWLTYQDHKLKQLTLDYFMVWVKLNCKQN